MDETSPLDGFKTLYSDLDFRSKGSKLQILEKLTPIVSKNLGQCRFDIGRLQKREFDISHLNDRCFLAVVGGSKKYRLRLQSAVETVDCVGSIKKETLLL